MRNFLQMKQELQRRARNTTISTASSELQDWFNGAREFLMKFPLPSLRRSWEVTTVASQAEYGLADRAGDISLVYMTSPERVLYRKDIEEINRDDPSPNTTINPSFYYLNGVRNVQNQPSSASVIRVQSSDGGDTTQGLRITGLVNDIIRSEKITLTGTTPVSGSLSFTEILELALDIIPTGFITIDSNSAAVINAVIPPNKISQEFTIMGFYPTPSTAAKTINVRGYAELIPLRNNEDIWPEEVQQLSMQYVYARWLEYDGNSRAGPAMAELVHPLNGRSGPMLAKVLQKSRRELDRTRFIKGGRRGRPIATRLLDSSFPPWAW